MGKPFTPLIRALSDARRSLVRAARLFATHISSLSNKAVVEKVIVDPRDPTTVYVVVRLRRSRAATPFRFLLQCTAEYEPACSILGCIVDWRARGPRRSRSRVEVAGVDELERIYGMLMRLDGCPTVYLNRLLKGDIPPCMLEAVDSWRSRTLRDILFH